ncbi:MAG: putative transposase, partial [Gaiellaceae bacterium]|nr:putative transposase [Gaiellaceae bacterium]
LRRARTARRAPERVWSWDITKLLGPAKWTYFYLYVILHVFSRYAVGWTVQHRERRPRCSYSEAQFKTLKYRPAFPRRFGSIEHARAHCRDFFDYYNHHHRHSGIALMTPATVHHGHAEQLHADRARVLAAAYARTPERFVRRAPTPPPVPTAAWINKPNTDEAAH